MPASGILGSFLRLVRSRIRKNQLPSLKGLASEQDTPRSSSQHKEDLFSSEEQDIGNKRQRQKIDIEEKGQWGRNKGRERAICPGDFLLVEKRQIQLIRKRSFIKVKWKPCVKMRG